MEKNSSAHSNHSSRRRLLEAARELFYEQGYVATTLAQISEKSGVNNGLITYYFKSKGKLAGEIFKECVLDLRNAITRNLLIRTKEYNMALEVALETRILLDQKLKNPKFLRFCNEYLKARDLFIPGGTQREQYYRMQKELINPNISDVDLKLYFVCGIAVTERVAEAYAANYIDCAPEYLKDYVTRALFTMLQLPKDEIDGLIHQSRQWESELRFTIGHSFQVSQI